ncbi:hypothetical protein B0H14DRAFT_2916764 [Mycena olivaceomarginata]|nr:hypothetical protein B0H14DRAFT_2916764 [Mycena olivaceomarginata]
MANNNGRKKGAMSAKAIVGKATIQRTQEQTDALLALIAKGKQDKLPKEDADKLKDMIDHIDRKKGLKLPLDDGGFEFITFHQMYAIIDKVRTEKLNDKDVQILEIADGVGDQVDILAQPLQTFAMIKGMDRGGFLLGEFLMALRALQKDVAANRWEHTNILIIPDSIMFVDGQSKTAQDCIQYSREPYYTVPLAHFSTVPRIRAIPRAGADITMVHFTSWTSTPVGKPGIVWIRENLHSYMVLIIHAIPPPEYTQPRPKEGDHLRDVEQFAHG